MKFEKIISLFIILLSIILSRKLKSKKALTKDNKHIFLKLYEAMKFETNDVCVETAHKAWKVILGKSSKEFNEIDINYNDTGCSFFNFLPDCLNCCKKKDGNKRIISDLRNVINEGNLVSVNLNQKHTFLILKNNRDNAFIFQSYVNLYTMKTWLDYMNEDGKSLEHILQKLRIITNKKSKSEDAKKAFIDLFIPDNNIRDTKEFKTGTIKVFLGYNSNFPMPFYQIKYQKISQDEKSEEKKVVDKKEYISLSIDDELKK